MHLSLCTLLLVLLLPTFSYAQRDISLSDLDISLTTTTADIQTTDLFGRSLLFRAVGNGAQKTAALLLERGADPNRRDKQGLTILALAIASADQRMVALLLERGADPNATFPPFAQTALHLLASLQEREAHIALAELLLEKGADPNMKDALGYSPIIYAKKSNQKYLKRLLIKHLRNPHISVFPRYKQQ